MKDSVGFIESMVTIAVQQNLEWLRRIGPNAIDQIDGKIGLVEYRLGVWKGHIGQFYIE